MFYVMFLRIKKLFNAFLVLVFRILCIYYTIQYLQIGTTYITTFLEKLKIMLSDFVFISKKVKRFVYAQKEDLNLSLFSISQLIEKKTFNFNIKYYTVGNSYVTQNIFLSILDGFYGIIKYLRYNIKVPTTRRYLYLKQITCIMYTMTYFRIKYSIFQQYLKILFLYYKVQQLPKLISLPPPGRELPPDVPI